MAYHTIKYEVENNILTLTLDRPDRMNAFTSGMARGLIDAFRRAGRDDEVRVVELTGSGKAFYAGMDLSGIRSQCSGIEGVAAFRK